MDSWHPDIRKALRVQKTPLRVDPHAGAELDAARMAKRNRLFQLIEKQPIGTVEKVTAMQRVMADLIAEQIEVNQLHAAILENNEPVYPIPLLEQKHGEAYS